MLVTDERTVFPTLTGRFKPAWWHGDDASDHCYGNMIALHPALRSFPASGYGDLQMAEMMENRPVVLLDDVPGHVGPIVWNLDVPWRMARKAYLFEARVGRGKLLVSTLDLSASRRKSDPAADWLRGRLSAYIASPQFAPAAEIPAEWLRQRVGAMAMPDPATWLEGFASVVGTAEPPQPWYTYREDRAATYPVRQSDGSQWLGWRTAAVPAQWPHGEVTFLWAGGIGWSSEPEGGPFALAMNGKPLLEFPFTVAGGTWRSPDGRAVLRYDVRRTVPPDSFGVFALTVPADLLTKGGPAELRVTAPRANSKRWFSLAPYRDVAREEAEP